jgi:alpha-1,3-rhamnosyl/mannosyltransferase
MKIGLSTSTLEPYHNRGHIDGIGTYTAHLLDGLKKLELEVVGYAFPPKSSGGLTFSQPFPGDFWVLSGMGILSGGLIKQSLPVDLMHFTDYRIFPAKCPVVATIHDAIPLKFPEMCNPDFRKIKNYIQKTTAKYADHVITLSQSSAADLIEFYGIPENKISVIGCGIGSDWFNAIDDDTLNKVLGKYSLQKGYFLFVGTLQPRKNLELIIDAYNLLPFNMKKERKLVCVGRQGWKCEKEILKLQKTINDGHAVWLDEVSDKEELRCIYTGAGVFLFPSLYEGFGIPVLEAFSCGVPVITSNGSSLPEVSCQVGIEIDPTSLDELFSAMEWLAQDESERKRRAIAGKKLARTMTWDAVVEKTINVYKNVI